MLLGRFGRMPGLYFSPDTGGGGGGGGTPGPEAGGAGTPATPSQSQPLTTGTPIATSDRAFQVALEGAGQQGMSQVIADLQTRINQVLSNAEEDRQRRSGLDRRFTQYDQRLDQIGQQIEQMLQLVGTNGSRDGQPPSKESAPPEQPPATAARIPDTGTQDLQQKLEQLEAQQARARAIRQVSNEMPGLNLFEWEDNIPLHRDPEKQAQAVRDFATRLQKTTSGAASSAAEQRERALTTGLTPGSSPSPPQGEQVDQKRYREIWDLMNNPAKWAGLPADERTSMEREFDTLSPRYGGTIGQGFTTPWAGPGELADMMRDMQQQIAGLKQQVNAGTVPGPEG